MNVKSNVEGASERVGGVPSPRETANAGNSARGGGTPPTTGATSRQRWQIGWITLGAVAVFLFLRYLPTGTNLNHMDFRVTGKNSIDFCDPLNPQFIPVVDVRSPVTMKLVGGSVAPRAGETVKETLTLTTASGKLIAPEDLLEVHTRKLHLLIIDPALEDYQHVHPQPGKMPGEWSFEFTPHRSGLYRVFADFTPAATARGLYANADLTIGRGAAGEEKPAGPRAANWEVERDGIRFTLTPGAGLLRARQPVDLKFAITRRDGGAIGLEPVMGAFAHLVAFDDGRRGFAHLHPMETDLLAAPDPVRPEFSFKITIPSAGRYVIWAQVKIGGSETFVPFWFEVGP